MTILSKKLKDYITIVSQNFMIWSEKTEVLTKVERKRQAKCRLAVIALVKLYKEIKLTEEEQELIEKYPLEYDYQNEMTNTIRRITEDTKQEAWPVYESILIEDRKRNKDILINKKWNCKPYEYYFARLRDYSILYYKVR